MCDGNGVLRYAAYKVDAVDSNGAGDVFHGAFAYAMTRGFDFMKACKFSSAVSALKCTKVGARAGVPDFASVIKFLKEHDPFFIFHDISFVVRRFTPYLAEKFKEYTEYEIKFQEERRLIERMRMGIRGRIESAKERLEEEGG